MDTNIIAVDWNVEFNNDVYYILYKNNLLKYIKNEQYTANLLFFCEQDQRSEVYKIATEFLRAFAYANDLRLLLYPGGIVNNNIRNFQDIVKIINGGGGRKNIPIDTKHSEAFIYVAKVDNDEKIELLRLYTEAISTNNIYFRILFLWHTLTFPFPNDNMAVAYINQNFESLKEYESYYDKLNKLKIFGDIELKKIGQHIKQNIRHSIAHIVRCRDTDINIEIDDLCQISYLRIIKEILQSLAKSRLDNDFQLSVNADKECILIDPETFDFNEYQYSLKY